MHGIRVLIISMLFVSSAAFASDWRIVKCGGRDHVTLENVAEFYSLGEMRRASLNFNLGDSPRGLRGAVGSNELYINNLKFILSYPVTEHDGKPVVSRMDLTKVIEPVLRPSRIKGADKVDTVILDPGHGGHDNGATSFYGNEKTFTMDVAARTKAALEQRGFKVHLTRTTDSFVPLEERVRFANRFSNALFISIHFNSGNSGASGLETYTLAPRGVPSMAADGPRLSDLQTCAGNSYDPENMALATAAHAALVSRSRLYDRGIKRARFVVIRDITIPGVLIEGGFLSSGADARKIAMPAYRQNMAQAITDAVLHYGRAVGSNAASGLLASKSSGSSTGPQVQHYPRVRLRATQPVVITSPTAN
jgi:N-acetylmuramoyl-L-alanine amidase